MREKAVLFLLGSGASRAAGMCMMSEITEKVLLGDLVYRYSDGSYHLGEAPSALIANETQEYLSPVLRFLQRLKLEIDRYYDPAHRATNYEDLHFLTSQVRDAIRGEYENPGLLALLEKLASETGLLAPDNGAVIKCDWTLLELASETANYIHDTVTALLSRPSERLDHLSFVVDACRELEPGQLTICTLNHDTVLEQVLRHHSIDYGDGFGEPVNRVRYFDANLLEGNSGSVRVLKLHGSINWHRLRPDDGHWSEDRVAIIEDPDWYHTKDPQGRQQMPMDPRPLLLIGTFNKALRYTEWFFSELFHQFHQSLRGADCLVICGYGFGDKGINSQVAQWVLMSGSRRMVVIHPDPKKITQSARGAMQRAFDFLEERGRFHAVPKRADEASWAELVT